MYPFAASQDNERPYYLPKKEKPAWNVGDEPSVDGFWAAFNQGRNFNKKQDEERQAARAARVAAEAAAEAAGEEDDGAEPASPWDDAASY